MWPPFFPCDLQFSFERLLKFKYDDKTLLFVRRKSRGRMKKQKAHCGRVIILKGEPFFFPDLERWAPIAQNFKAFYLRDFKRYEDVVNT